VLILIRDIRACEAVLGRLYHNGGIVCYTLENAVKAIPCGMYNVQNSKSPKFNRELPLIYNSTIKASRGIRIHRGNTAKDSQGCVLVGMDQHGTAPNTSPLLLESANAETMVTMICRNDHELTICDCMH
jgi:hypothetical protein